MVVGQCATRGGGSSSRVILAPSSMNITTRGMRQQDLHLGSRLHHISASRNASRHDFCSAKKGHKEPHLVQGALQQRKQHAGGEGALEQVGAAAADAAHAADC